MLGKLILNFGSYADYRYHVTFEMAGDIFFPSFVFKLKVLDLTIRNVDGS